MRISIIRGVMDRLVLTPLSPRHLLALIESYESFEESFAMPAAQGLREFLVSDDVSPTWLEQLRQVQQPDPWVHGFAVVHDEQRLVIGNLGFKGPPGEGGTVEIAYGIAPVFQGRGYATEAAQTGIRFAFADARVSIVRAHTLPEPNASTRVLEKCGFAHSGAIDDPEDGLVWRWDLPRRSQS